MEWRAKRFFQKRSIPVQEFLYTQNIRLLFGDQIEDAVGKEIPFDIHGEQFEHVPIISRNAQGKENRPSVRAAKMVQAGMM